MSNDAVYVIDKSAADGDKSEIGVCPMSVAVSKPNLMFLVRSQDAEEIYKLVGRMMHPKFATPLESVVDCRLSPRNAAAHVMAACGANIIGARPFRFTVAINRCLTASSLWQ